MKNGKPGLMIVQAMWGLVRYPSKDDEWPIERKLEAVKEAGFDAVDLDIPYVTGQEAYWEALLTRYGLKLGLQGPFINNLNELEACMTIVKRMGAPYLDAQVGHAFIPEDGAEELLRALAGRADEAGVRLLVQTHRGRVTQDLLRTVRYCQAIPNLKLNLDLSHFFVSGEFGAEALPREAEEAFDVLLRRTHMIDGRVSNGHQVQIDIGTDAGSPFVENFANLWKKAMLYWLEKHGPEDVFIFRPELGPPPYSIVGNLTGKETSNRWEQAQVMAGLARRLWSEAVSEAGYS